MSPGFVKGVIAWGALALPVLYYVAKYTIGVDTDLQNLWLLPVGYVLGITFSACVEVEQ